jgi:hypothetical protein
MKVEKEVLIKHHFWILLAVLIPLVLIAMIVLWTATASAIEAKEKAFKDSEKSLQGINKPKNDKWLVALKVRANEVAKQKNLIWGEAWERQKDLFTWPDELSPEDRQTLEKKYFADEIPWQIREKYSQPDGPYNSQFAPIVNLVNPVNGKGEGMVQYNGGWEALIPPFDLSKIPASNRPIPAEELWILQEDLAVYRELLRIIKEVNEMVATFHKVPDPPKPDQSKGEIDHQIFTNANWKLDLILAEQKNKKVFRCQVTNISQRRQPLGIWFVVQIKGFPEPQGFFVDGEPLPPGATIPVKDRDGNDQGPQTQSGFLEGEVLEKVVQWFDWRTAPVKRIDKLALGYHSQRTAGRGLRTLKKWEPVKEDNAGTQQTSGSEDTSGQMAKQMGKIMGQGRMMGMGGGIGGGGFGGGASGEKTKDGLPKNRYVDVSDQVRRMPIGIAVVIDQEHIADFLTVVANSKIRIQTTQVYWQRFHGDIKPKITKDEEKPEPKTTSKSKRTASTAPRMNLGAPMGGAKFGGYDASKMRTMMQGMQMSMGGRFGRGEGQPLRTGTTGAATTEEGEEELDSNLVELAVHGIASLYEKFPPPPEVAAAPANP